MNIAILASGEGTNVENILSYFEQSENFFIVITNNPTAKVLNRAKIFNVETYVAKTSEILDILDFNQIEFVVLAGYIKLIPLEVINAYQNKIINIHPSLLPKYGGRGMWGMNVHSEVIKNKEIESGITIHYVDEYYDNGAIIEQHKCKVESDDTPISLAKKISLLEREYFPKCIERLLTSF